MKPAVKANFHRLSDDLEGVTTWLYADALGLLTTGVGNLVNDLPSVLALPWKRPDGTHATRDEVVSAYAAVRAAADENKLRGGGWFARLTTIRLDRADVDAMVERKLESNWLLLSRRFPDADSWPADAQLFLCSWAWAVGPAAPYPRMSAALREGDFDTAALECTVTANGKEFGTLIERNRRNRVLLRNASRVRAFGLDPDVVHWPTDLAAVVAPAETLPEGVDPAESMQARREMLAEALPKLEYFSSEDSDDEES